MSEDPKKSKIEDLPDWAKRLAFTMVSHIDMDVRSTSVDCMLNQETLDDDIHYWVLAIYPSIIERKEGELRASFEHVLATEILKTFDDPSEAAIRMLNQYGYFILSFDGVFQGRSVVAEVHFEAWKANQEPLSIIHTSTTVH